MPCSSDAIVLFSVEQSSIIISCFLSQCDLTPTFRIMSAILNAANSSFKVRETKTENAQINCQ